MSVHVTLGNAAVVAAGLCSSLCDRAKEEYMSGQLGRDIKAKYMRLSQGPDRCFLCSSVQCLKHLSPGQVRGEFPFSWLIAEFRLLQDCVLIAFLASRAGVQCDSPQPLAQPCSEPAFSAGFVATPRRYPTEPSWSAGTAQHSGLVQHIQGVARGKQLRWAQLSLSELSFEQMPTLPCAGGPVFGLPGKKGRSCVSYMRDLLGKPFWAAKELYNYS